MFREGSTKRGNYSRCRSGRGLGGTRKEAEEVHLIGSGEVNSGERWFNMETTPAERCAMFDLEREMDATLIFEHGGGQKASQLWVTRILLGTLFREQLVLGHVVKTFVKFQRREIMRGLVKLNDLEELAKPPLGGTPEATTSGLPKEEMLDLEVEDAIQEEENAAT